MHTNANSTPALQPFYVLLLYPDYMSDSYGHETYFAHVEAETAASAVEAAQAAAAYANRNDESADDFYPLLVLRGHVEPETV